MATRKVREVVKNQVWAGGGNIIADIASIAVPLLGKLFGGKYKKRTSRKGRGTRLA